MKETLERPDGTLIFVDPEGFREALSYAEKRNVLHESVMYIEYQDDTIRPVICDPYNPENQLTIKSEPYKTWRGAYAAVGAVIDANAARMASIQAAIDAEDAAAQS